MILIDKDQILMTCDELEQILKKEYERGFSDAKGEKAMPQSDFSIGSCLFRMGVVLHAD